MTPSDFITFRFSTDDIPERDRVAVWREELGRKLIRLDIEPDRHTPFHGYFQCCVLPNLSITRGGCDASVDRRTPELIAGDLDHLILAINLSGTFAGRRGNREIVCGASDAFLLSFSDPACYVRATVGEILTLRVPRAALDASVRNLDDATMRPIPRNSEALRLLKTYVGLIEDNNHEVATPALRHSIASHVHDLIACIIGDMRGGGRAPATSGVQAARLHAIKADVAANAARRDLTLDAVAARHNISPRHIRRLLASEGTSFTDLVQGQRLLRAYRLLTDPQSAGRSVSEIGFAVGFGDLSYFNRTFRRRFGCTPSEARERAMREP